MIVHTHDFKLWWLKQGDLKSTSVLAYMARPWFKKGVQCLIQIVNLTVARVTKETSLWSCCKEFPRSTKWSRENTSTVSNSIPPAGSWSKQQGEKRTCTSITLCLRAANAEWVPVTHFYSFTAPPLMISLAPWTFPFLETWMRNVLHMLMCLNTWWSVAIWEGYRTSRRWDTDRGSVCFLFSLSILCMKIWSDNFLFLPGFSWVLSCLSTFQSLWNHVYKPIFC